MKEGFFLLLSKADKVMGQQSFGINTYLHMLGPNLDSVTILDMEFVRTNTYVNVSSPMYYSSCYYVFIPDLRVTFGDQVSTK